MRFRLVRMGDLGVAVTGNPTIDTISGLHERWKVMKLVHSADDPILIGYLKSVLEARGVACCVKNEWLGGGAGELPPNECWPELWVINEHECEQATRIVGEVLAETSTNNEPWRCEHCGEPGEPGFYACWRCGVQRTV